MSLGSTPKEAENDLISISKLKIVDLISEGEIAGFWPKSGISGNNPLVSTYFDDVPVLESDGSPNINTSGRGFKFAYKLGVSGEGSLSNFSKVEASIPLPYSTRLFNPPPGKGDYRAVTLAFNTTSYPDATAIKLTVKIPALYKQDKKGNVKKYSISYAVDISVNNGPFITALTNTINGKCTSPYLKSHIISLPRPDISGKYDWKLRIRRTSENVVNDSKVANELYLEAASIISANSFSYPMSAMVGFEFGADQISSVPTRAYDIMGQKVSVPDGYVPTEYHPDGSVKTPAQYPAIWNGTWSTTKVWTNNPAWIYYDILVNKRYGLGNYFINDWIDKWTLYEIAQYCDELVYDGSGDTGNTYKGLEPRFTCNVCIQERQDAYDLINSLSSVFRGITYWSNGRSIPIQDKLKDPIFNYTNANVENGLFNYSDSAKNTRSTIANIKWNDPKNLFREKIEIVEDSEGILKYGYIEKNLNAFACTSQGQAHRVGQWLLLTERSLTETISFKIGIDGLVIRPGDIFNVYDNYRTSQKQGGRILEQISSSGFKLDREVTLQSGISYNLSVIIPQKTYDASGDITSSNQISLIRNSQIDTKPVFTSATGTDIITISGSFRNGSFNNITGAIWLLNGYSQNSGHLYEVKTYKCLNISESENLKFDILGLQYNSGLYALMETGFSTKINTENTGIGDIPLPPSGLNLSFLTGIDNEAEEAIFSILASWTQSQSTNTSYYRVSGFYSGQDAKLIGTTNDTKYFFYPETIGNVGVSVGAVNIYGNESPYVSGNIYVLSQNPFGLPTTSGTTIVNGGSSTSITDSSFDIGWGYSGDDIRRDLITETYINIFNISGVLVQKEKIPTSGTTYHLTVNDVQNFSGGALREFDVIIENLDTFGYATSGAATRFSNPVPRPPVESGFNLTSRGLSYNIIPNYLDTDLSGLAIWYQSGSFINPPTFDSVDYFSSTFANTIPGIFTGTKQIYFSLIDTLGTIGCPIYGPVELQTQNNILNSIHAYGFPSISGEAIISGRGIEVSQTGNTIMIKGQPGGVTGIGKPGQLVTGGIEVISAGSVTILQSGTKIWISGEAMSGINPGIFISSTGTFISLNSTGQTLNAGTTTPINWSNTIRYSNLYLADSSRIYIDDNAGYYNLSAKLNSNTYNFNDEFAWRRNGTEILSNNNSSVTNTYLNANDYVEFIVNSYSGTTLSTSYCDIVKIPDQQLALTGAMKTTGVGTVSVFTQYDTLFISGKVPSAINFFFQQPMSGYRVAEALVCGHTNLTGFLTCTSGNVNRTINGTFYRISIDNQNKTNLFNFSIQSGYSANSGSFFHTIPPFSKVGIDLPDYETGNVGSFAFAVFGYE